MTLGQMIDKMNDIREKKRALAEEEKALTAQYDELKGEVIAKLRAEDADKASGKKATASISENVVATIEDWDALTKYIKRTGHFHLFQRRVSDPAFRELLEMKGGVPGLTPFTKVDIRLTALK